MYKMNPEEIIHQTLKYWQFMLPSIQIPIY
jgi:hypothetical protein